MSTEYDPRFLWVIQSPDDIEILKFIGRSVKVLGPVGSPSPKERVIVIEKIMGSLSDCKCAEVQRFVDTDHQESYLIPFVDLFNQMNGDNIPKEQIDLFNETQFEIVETRLNPWTRTRSQNSWRRKNGLLRRN